MKNTEEQVPEWKAERIRALEEALEFWSEKNKFNRECYVVSTLLRSIDVPYEKSELARGSEPVDVAFRDSNFQVKEVMQPGRKRTDEYREALDRARKARTYSDLLESYTPAGIPLSCIISKSVARSIELKKKYGPVERASLDLLCYFNFDGIEEHHSDFELPEKQEFKSLSVVSNFFTVVLYADVSAAQFLQENTRILHRASHPEYS